MPTCLLTVTAEESKGVRPSRTPDGKRGAYNCKLQAHVSKPGESPEMARREVWEAMFCVSAVDCAKDTSCLTEAPAAFRGRGLNDASKNKPSKGSCRKVYARRAPTRSARSRAGIAARAQARRKRGLNDGRRSCLKRCPSYATLIDSSLFNKMPTNAS